MIYIETKEDSFEFDISCKIEYMPSDSYWIFVKDSSNRLVAAFPKSMITSIEYEYEDR